MINKKIFLENLPKKKYKDKEKIDWSNSIGYKIRFIYEDIKDEFEIIEYDKKYQKLKIKYNDKIYEKDTNGIINCEIGKIIGKIKTGFIYNIGEIINNKKIIDRTYIKDKNGVKRKSYKYICLNCGFDCGKHWKIRDKCYKDEYWINEFQLKNSNDKCSCCSGVPKIISKGINDIATTHPYLVEYFVNKEDGYNHTYCSVDKILIKCPNCKYTYKTKLSQLSQSGFNCPKCGDNFPYTEKVMFNLLEQFNIDFIYQYTKLNNCWVKNYRYDFYFELNNEKYIIETNGMQHYEDTRSFKTKLKDIQENDKNKMELAINNGIKPENYIVIDCRYSIINYIKNNIIKSKLSKLFDFSKIDWEEIIKNSNKNILYEVCNYWNNKKYEETVSDLCEKFKIGKTTIRTFLNKGTKLGICNYNPKEELIKAVKINGQNNVKTIIVIKDNNKIGTFKGMKEVKDYIYNNYKIKITNTGISSVANNKNKTHKGFVFKYV